MSNSNISNCSSSSRELCNNDNTTILSLTVNSNSELQQQQQRQMMLITIIHNKRINEIKKFYIAYYVLLCIDLCFIFVYNNILATVYNITWLFISIFSLIYYNIIIIRKYKYKYTTTHNNNNTINLGIGILLLITTLTDITYLIYHYILSNLSSFLFLFTYIALTQQSPYYYLLILFYISLNMTFPIVNLILLKRM
jgi:hypothetical protein